MHTYRTCPVQTFGRAGTNLGRAAGRDLESDVVEGLGSEEDTRQDREVDALPREEGGAPR